MQRRTFLATAAAAGAAPLFAQSKGWLMFVGTYTKQGSKGIYSWRLEPSGKITPIGLAAETSNPSFLAIHPNGRFLYAVNEDDEGNLSTFSIENPAGMLKPINKVSTKGGWPCHVMFDHTGKVAYVANYKDGSVASFMVGKDGSAEPAAFVKHHGSSVDKERQEGPHAHMTAVSPDNKFVLVPDLGLDQVMIYKVDTAKGTLEPSKPAFLPLKPGTGPRHLAWSKDGKFIYVLGELQATVTVFAWDAGKGSGSALQTVSMLPADFTGLKSGAEIEVHPSGKFLYASNRGHDSIALFQIDAAKGTLTAGDRASTRGKTPRNFAIDPTGNFIFAANQDGNTIATFRIDLSTGHLAPLGDLIPATQPVCIVFQAAK